MKYLLIDKISDYIIIFKFLILTNFTLKLMIFDFNFKFFWAIINNSIKTKIKKMYFSKITIIIKISKKSFYAK